MSTPTTWNSGGSTDANNAANYSAALPADAVVTLNNTSVVNWIFTANMSVESITIANNYTGVVTMTGFTLTCSLGFSDDGITGAHTYGLALTCQGASSTLHIGAGLASIVGGSCQITMSGNTGMTLDMDIVFTFRALIITGVVTITNAAACVANGGAVAIPLQVTNGTVTINAAISFVGTGVDLYSFTGVCTFNGNAAVSFRSTLACNAPAMTYTGNGSINFTSSSTNNPTYTMTGNINTGTASLNITKGSNAANAFNCGAFNITCGAFTPGNSNATQTLSINFGSGTHSFTSFSGLGSRVGAIAMNFSTSQISCSGNWTFVAADAITTGSFLLTITNTSSITSAGKSFYDLTINAATKTITLIDALVCAAGGDLTLTAGTLNLATFNLTVGGNTAINGTSTLTATASTCSFAGNYTTAVGCTVTINAATNYTFTAFAVVTTNGKALPQCTFNANFTLNDSCTIARLIFGVDGITGTFESGQTFTITNLTAANWSGSAGLLNRFQSFTPGAQYTFAIPNAVILSYVNPQDSNLSAAFQINCMDGTSVNGGNNDTDWLFPATVGGGAAQRISKSRIAITMGI